MTPIRLRRSNVTFGFVRFPWGPARPGAEPRERDPLVVTDVLWISGAIAAGVGVTLFILSDDHTESGTALQTGCFAGGCGSRASGRF